MLTSEASKQRVWLHRLFEVHTRREPEQVHCRVLSMVWRPKTSLLIR